MMRGLTRRIFGTANERVVKAYAHQVDAVNSLESELEALSDDALRARTAEFRERLRHVELFLQVHAAARRLLAVAEGRIEDENPCVHDRVSAYWSPPR